MNPLTGAEETVVEAVKGGQDALESEAATPAMWVWGGSSWRSVPEGSGIPDETILRVVDATRRAAEGSRMPIRLEWACHDEGLAITHSSKMIMESELVVHSIVALGFLPDVIGPMDWSLLGPIADRAMARLLSELTGAGSLQAKGLVRRFYCRPYLNMTEAADALRMRPLPPDTLDRFLSFRPSIVPAVMHASEAGANEVMRGFLLDRIGSQADAERSLQAKHAHFRGFTGDGASSLSETQSLDRIDALVAELGELVYLDLLLQAASSCLSDDRMTEPSARSSKLISEVLGHIRMVLIGLGERFLGSGVLADKGDISLLTIDEARQIVAGGCAGNTCNNYRLRAALRRRETASCRESRAPTVINGEVPPLEIVRVAMRGTPISRGSFTGRARVLRSPAEAATISAKEVLVIPFLGGAWTPMITQAGAVVAGSGGLLSRASFAAREHGVPAVVPVGEAMTMLRDGDVVHIDGSNGLVALADRKDEPAI